jgi:hypothetical protein
MRKLLSLATAVVTAFTLSAAQATVISIDDFNSPDMYASSGVIGVGDVQVGGLGIAPGGRTVTHTLTLGTNVAVPFGGGTGHIGTASGVTVGTVANPTGSMAMYNATGSNSVVDLKWSLSSVITTQIDTAAPLSFFFAIVGSDTVAKNIEYSLNGTTYTTLVSGFATAVSAPTSIPLTVALSQAEAIAIKNNGNATDLWLRFSGNEGWDLSIDSVGLSTPEPTSLALVGLALVGAGVVARRRKA